MSLNPEDPELCTRPSSPRRGVHRSVPRASECLPRIIQASSGKAAASREMSRCRLHVASLFLGRSLKREPPLAPCLITEDTCREPWPGLLQTSPPCPPPPVPHRPHLPTTRLEFRLHRRPCGAFSGPTAPPRSLPSPPSSWTRS